MISAGALVAIAERAGREILDVYGDEFTVEQKADRSPVTAADTRAEAVIVAALRELAPDVAVVAEEQFSRGDVPAVAPRFFLVDPLDGTKEFVSRNGEFTVNIALIEDGLPTSGVVHLPATDTTYWTADGAWRRAGARTPEQIACRAIGPDDGLVVVASRSHRDAATEEYLATLKVAETVAAGSSLKFCRVAEGSADVYPRFGRTMEWDTAAGHAVLRAAGGEVWTREEQPLRYGKPGYANPAFIARGAMSPP